MRKLLCLLCLLCLCGCGKDKEEVPAPTEAPNDFVVDFGTSSVMEEDKTFETVKDGLYYVYEEGNTRYSFSPLKDDTDLSPLIYTLRKEEFYHNITLFEIDLTALDVEGSEEDAITYGLAYDNFPGYTGDSFWLGSYTTEDTSFSVYLFKQNDGSYFYTVEEVF